MSVRAVIDTNVLVSSLMSKSGDSPPVRIARAMANGIFTPVFSSDILDEYEDVLGRAHFKFDPEEVSLLIRKIKENGKDVAPIDCDDDFPDPDDKVFFCTALAADARIVTGNIKHYPMSAIVVTPAEFCKLLGI